jgi:cell division septation protein DedD
VLVSPPTPVSQPAAPQPGRYTVQVGALRDQANADQLVAQLRAHGFTPIVSKDTLYRVRVGEDLNRNAAVQLAATLQAAGFDTFVRTY